MQTFLLNINGPPPKKVDAFVMLQQRDWSPYDGVLSNSTVANGLENLIYRVPGVSRNITPIPSLGDAEYNEPTIHYDGDGVADRGMPQVGASMPALSGNKGTAMNCAAFNGELIATIYTYPFPSSLYYSLKCTRGYLRKVSEKLELFKEMIQVRLQDHETAIAAQYPIDSVSFVGWYGDVYTEDGEVIINKPVIRREGNEFYVDRRVFGTIDAHYYVEKHIYEVVVPSKEVDADIESEKYDSVVYAVYTGGVNWLKVNAGMSAEANSWCEKGWNIDWEIDPNNKPLYAEPKDKTEEFDYCSGEKTDETIS
jgi:hypothetical protein